MEIKTVFAKSLRAKYLPDWMIISLRSRISEDRPNCAIYQLSLVIQVLNSI